MNAKKRLGFALIGMGAVLLTAALLLFLHNDAEDARADTSAKTALAAIRGGLNVTEAPEEPEQAAEKTEEPVVPAATEGTKAASQETLPIRTVEGHDYIGSLHFPAWEKELPVMVLVYVEDLQLAPCIQKGSPLTDDAVISGHNYPSQFGLLKDLKSGDSVIFEDNGGNTISYTVREIRTLSPEEEERILESGYDLTLYTCTPGGGSRVLAGCDRV